MGEVIKSYKGFNKDMTCTPPNTNIKFQYEEGKEYETKYVAACNCGFHGCEMPLDTFKYYQPSKSVYHEVEQSGEVDRGTDDSKIASTKIKIGTKIGIKELVRAQIDFVYKKVKWRKDSQRNTSGEESSAATSGYGSSAATSDNGSSAAASGYGSSAATSGEESSASTSGNGSSAATSGEESSASTSGKNSIALACGKNAKAKGVIGSYIVVTEWNDDADTLISVKIVQIDGEKYKPDTWYKMDSSEIVEANDEN